MNPSVFYEQGIYSVPGKLCLLKDNTVVTVTWFFLMIHKYYNTSWAENIAGAKIQCVSLSEMGTVWNIPCLKPFQQRHSQQTKCLLLGHDLQCLSSWTLLVPCMLKQHIQVLLTWAKLCYVSNYLKIAACECWGLYSCVVVGSILLDYKATSVGKWFQMVHSNVVALSSRVHTPEKNSFQTLMISNDIPLKYQELITQWCNIISQKSLQLQTPLLRFYTASIRETKHLL